MPKRKSQLRPLKQRAARDHRFRSLRMETLEDRRLLAAVPVPSGLVAWWTGDGTVLDANGSSNGILEGGATYAPGKVGQAFKFDGIDDRVRIPNNPTLNALSSFTIEAWVLSNDSPQQAIASNDSFIFLDAGKPGVQLNDASKTPFAGLTGASTITIGQWTHVAATYDTTALKLYFNGALDGEVNVDTNRVMRSSTDDLFFGSLLTQQYFSGLIDEVSLYSRALSAGEIQSIYQAGSDGKVKTSAMNVVGSNPAAGLIVNGAATDFAVDFTFAYDIASVQASDFEVNGRPADSVVATDPDTITFHFDISPVMPLGGVQTMAMAAGAITTSIPGVDKPGLSAWTATFQARLSSTTFSSQLVDLLPGAESSNAADYQGFDGSSDIAFFRAFDGTSTSLWKTDGTAAGTFKVSTTPDMTLSVRDTAYVNGTLFFFVQESSGQFQYQLWKSDGTAGGTSLLGSGWRRTNDGSSTIMGSVGNYVFFTIRDPTLGHQLWRSDGTANGTILLKDVNPNGRIPNRNDILSSGSVTFNGRLYFIANDGTHGDEVWASDGTPEGTVMVNDLNPGSASNGQPPSFGSFFVLNGFVYFRGQDGNPGSGRFGLWKTDGTVGGTSLVKEAANFPFRPIASLLGKIYITASDELWVTDGTANGTTLLKMLSVKSTPVQVGQNVFFAADDGVHGNALWKTDGTPAGTVMVRAITGSSSGGIAWLTEVNGKLFFTADDALSGNELWESDGTEAGTILAKDINPGPTSSSPENLHSVNNQLVFSADDGVHGYELWVGTSANNSLPLARSSQVTAVQETALPITLFATDFDNDGLTYGVINPPLHGTLSGTAPNLVYTPTAQYTGPDSFTFRANDGKEDSNLATVAITVISNAPVAQGVNAVTKVNRPVNVTLAATDPRNLPLTYTISSGPLHGTLSGTAPNLIYTPALDYLGPDSFSYQASNGQSTSSAASVSIDVVFNRVPTADDVFLLGVSAHKPSVVRVSASDPDGDPLTYIIVDPPRSGTLVQQGQDLIYVPGAVPDVEASFTYQASDGIALSNVATAIVLLSQYKVTVYAEDGEQNILGAAQELFAEVPPGGSPDLAFATSSNNQPLFTQQPTIDSTGTLNFTPAPNSQGTATVTVVKTSVGGGFEGEEGDYETAEFVIEVVQKAPWQNDVHPDDVDNQGGINATDVIIVINRINGTGSGEITDTNSQGPFYDADGDNYVTASDVLDIINWINHPDGGEEGEFVKTVPVSKPAGRVASAAASELDWLNCVAEDVAGQPKRGRVG